MLIGKIDGKRNPGNTLTKHVATESEMLESLGGLGVLDLIDKGFEEHTRCTKLRIVSRCFKCRVQEVETACGIDSYAMVQSCADVGCYLHNGRKHRPQ